MSEARPPLHSLHLVHQPTADLLTQHLDIHEKTAWMLRPLLEG